MTDHPTPAPDAVARVLAELDALLYGEDEDERLCNGAGDAYRAGDHSNRIFLTIGHILTLRDALAAREQEVAEMRHQRDSRMELLAGWDAKLGRAEAENADLRAQLAAAQEALVLQRSALENWGRHHSWCASLITTSSAVGTGLNDTLSLTSCNCGFAAALTPEVPRG